MRTLKRKAPKRFTTYLMRAIVLLVVGSVILASVALYIYFGNKLQSEFSQKVLAQKGQVELILGEKIVKLQNSIRNLSRDNTIRITLMLNVRSQLEERLASLYPSSGGTYYFIKKSSDKHLYPLSHPGLPQPILNQVMPSAPHGKPVPEGSRIRMIWCFSAPIMKGADKMGTAFVIYDLTEDAALIEKLYRLIDGDIALVKDTTFYNLTAKQHWTITPRLLQHLPRSSGFSPLSENAVIARLDGFRSLFFIFSTRALAHEKQRIRLLIMVFAFAILVFSATLSVFLGRQLGRPLQRMTAKAMLISQGEKTIQFDSHSGFREFDQLSYAFNYMLEHLQAAEEKSRFQELLQNVDDAVYLIDARGRFLNANEATYTQLGYSRDDFFSLGLRDLLPPADAETILEIITGETGFTKRRIETSHRTADGRHIPMEIISRSIRYSNETAVLNVARDITSRVEASRALRESEERYRSVVENAHDGILLLDEDLKIVFANSESCRILRYAVDEMVGKSFKKFWAHVIGPQTLEKRLKAGKSSFSDEFELRRKDGQIRRCKISVAVTRDSSGHHQTVMHLLDVTDRLRAEAEKKQLEQLLIHAQKMEAIGTLAGGIAHDFNNLLMAIQGRIALIELQLDAQDPNNEHIQAIGKAVKSAAGLTKQLLGYARGGKYQVKLTDMNELVGKSAQMFSRTKKEITLHTDFDPHLFPVEVDRGQIEQVLLNLYVNAWQAMPEGGDLYLMTQNVTLSAADCQPFNVEPGVYVNVSVRDTGVGMDSSVLERIFEPFFTTKEIGIGTGLGLASAYGIIRNHHGVIHVKSRRGAGSTFDIYLPCSDCSILDLREEKDHRKGRIRHGSETVLLVDAEEGVRQVGKLMIKALGYDLLLAANGEDAIELYRRHRERVALVILDMTMPEMSGSETFKRLKEVDPDVKVLLSSGYDLNAKAEDLLQSGYAGFIQKPFDLKGLSETIRNLLDNESL